MLLEPGVCRKYSQHARSPASVQLVLPACSKSCEHAEVQPACTKSSQHAQSPASMHRVQPACRKSSKHERHTGGQVQVRIVDSTSQWFRVPYTMSLRSKSGGTRARCYISRHPHRGRSQDIRRIEGRAFLPGTGQARNLSACRRKKEQPRFGTRSKKIKLERWMDGWKVVLSRAKQQATFSVRIHRPVTCRSILRICMTANTKAVVRRLGKPVSRLSQMNLQR